MVNSFCTPTNLHYSQTSSHFNHCGDKFCIPTNLHSSQTTCIILFFVYKFCIPTNLHYSQTGDTIIKKLCGFVYLQIYTTLKPQIQK